MSSTENNPKEDPGGRLSTDEVELSWSVDAIVIHRAPHLRSSPTTAEQGVLQLSRFTRVQEQGFLEKLLRRNKRTEHWLGVELRFKGSYRFAFSARVNDTQALEGLAHYAITAETVSYGDLRSLMMTATALGCELAQVGAHAHTPLEEEPQSAVALPSNDQHTHISDAQTLRKALASPVPGRVIRLAEGDYHLGSVHLDGAYHILGAGAQKTRLLLDSGPAWGMLCSGEGSIVLRDLSLVSDDAQAAGVLQVNNGVLALLGVYIRAHPDMVDAAGVRITGTSKVHMEDCCVEHCHGAVVVNGSASGRVVGNTLLHNFAGLVISDVAEVTAAGNVVMENTTGIDLKGASTATIQGNSVLLNSAVGISAGAQSRVRLINNLCESNGRGISVRCTYPVELEGNLCVGNTNAGIHFAEGNAGTVLRCVCRWNRNGIETTTANCDAILRENHCIDNRFAGIRVGAGAPLHIIDNLLARNATGIHVEPGQIGDWTSAGPTLERNVCEDNHKVGIRFDGNAVARGNLCRNNREDDFVIEPTVDVVFEDNYTGT